MGIRSFLGTMALGAGLFAGITLSGSVSSIRSDEERTRSIRSSEFRHFEDFGKLASPEQVAADSRNEFQKYCDHVMGYFTNGFDRRRTELEARRKGIAIRYAFATGNTEQYMHLIEEAATGDDPNLFFSFYDGVRKSGDGRFDDIIKQRLENGNIVFVNNDTRKMDEIRMKDDEIKRRSVERDLLNIVGKRDPGFVVRYEARQLEQTSDPWPHMLVIGGTGGEEAIDYIMRRFDEGGLKYSSHLVAAVRSEEQARRVGEFLVNKLVTWQGPYSHFRYACLDMKQLVRRYSSVAMPYPTCN